MMSPYSDAVLRYFRDPQHAGNLEADFSQAKAAYVEEGGAGARILLTAATDGARLRAVRFAVFGCPHLIAAAELACERLEGQPVEAALVMAFGGVEPVKGAYRAAVETGYRFFSYGDAMLLLRDGSDAGGEVR